MSFGAPSVLWFLLLAGIPILIHLFRFKRYKKTLFTRLDLLKDIVVQTGFGNKLRKWLLLVIRTLALLLLVLAFARPFIPNQGLTEKGLDTVLIYLDNSLSMSGDGSEGPVFEAAKNRARSFVEAAGNNKSFLLLTHDSERDASQVMDKQEILTEIDRLQIAEVAKTEVECLDQLLFLENKEVITAMISDFRKGSLLAFEGKKSQAGKHYWLPVPAKHAQNLNVDSVWFDTPQLLPNQSVTLSFRVHNSGNEDQNDISIRFVEEEQFKGNSVVSVAAGQKVTTSIVFKTGESGWKNAILELPGDDFSFDDLFYLSYRVQKGSKGLVLHSAPNSPYLSALFASSPGFDVLFQSPLQANFSYLASCDFVILDGVIEPNSGLELELKKFVAAGGNLFFIPSTQAHPEKWNAFLGGIQAGAFLNNVNQSVEAALWDLQSPMLNGVFEKIPNQPDLPKVEQYYRYQAAGRQLPLWKLKNDDVLTYHSSFESGKVFVFTVAFDKTFGSFPRHPLFVPFMLRLVSYKKSDAPLYFYTGVSQLVQLPTDVEWQPSETYLLKGKESQWRAALQTREKKMYLSLQGELKQVGNYQLFDKNEKALFSMACNHRNQESIGAIETQEELKNKASIFGSEVKFSVPSVLQAELTQDWNGKSLAKYFLISALILLILEMVLIRIWKM